MIFLILDVSKSTYSVHKNPFLVCSVFNWQLIFMIHAKRVRAERKGNKEMLLESDESQTVPPARRSPGSFTLHLSNLTLSFYFILNSDLLILKRFFAIISAEDFQI